MTEIHMEISEDWMERIYRDFNRSTRSIGREEKWGWMGMMKDGDGEIG